MPAWATAVMFKYSIAMTNLFGAVDSKYSQYFDLSGNFDTGVWGLTVNAHVGRQTVRNVDNGSTRTGSWA